jgi:hypothetical protein
MATSSGNRSIQARTPAQSRQRLAPTIWQARGGEISRPLLMPHMGIV